LINVARPLKIADRKCLKWCWSDFRC